MNILREARRFPSVKRDGIVNEITKLIDKNKISTSGLNEDVIKGAAQINVKAVEAIAEAIINKKVSPDPKNEVGQVAEIDPVNILGLLVHQDNEMRKTEHEQAEVFKKMLFPNDDFYSDSSKSETGSQKLLSSCEKIKTQIEGSLKLNREASPKTINDLALS